MEANIDMASPVKKIIVSCVVISCVVCVCLALIGIGWGSSIALEPLFPQRRSLTPTRRMPTRTTTPTKPSTATPISQLNPTSTQPSEGNPADTPTSQPTEPSLPEEIANQMDEIQNQVSALRGLQAQKSIPRNLITTDQLRQYVIEDFLKDYSAEEARQDTLELSVFGLLDPDFDLFNFYQSLLIEQISGFYDQEKEQMYVIQGEGFGGMERFVFSHEYNHNLQDQNFDFEDGLKLDDLTCEKDNERCAAIQALIEGDSTLLSLQWLREYGTRQDMQDIQKAVGELSQPIYDSAPEFIKEDFGFPYQAGQEFVQALFNEGGWEAVDQAYRDVPLSTEQILHPDRYPADKPILVDLPDLAPVLGEGWTEITRNTMGEWYTYLILALGVNPTTRLDQDQAKRAAEGWGGDTYVVFYNETTQTTTMVLSAVWDTTSDASEYAIILKKYLKLRFGNAIFDQANKTDWQIDEAYIQIHLEKKQTTWIHTTTKEMAQQIWEIVQTK